MSVNGHILFSFLNNNNPIQIYKQIYITISDKQK